MLSFILACFCKSQVVNIPDANFKAYLVGDNSINTNADTEIQVSEATSFTGSINCSNRNISDLTGIEAFTNITSINAAYNKLTSLNAVSYTHLDVYKRQILYRNIPNFKRLKKYADLAYYTPPPLFRFDSIFIEIQVEYYKRFFATFFKTKSHT